MRPTRLPASGAKPSAAKTSTPARTAPLPGDPPARGQPLPVRAKASRASAAPAAPPRVACKSIGRKNPRVLYTVRPQAGSMPVRGSGRSYRAPSEPAPSSRPSLLRFPAFVELAAAAGGPGRSARAEIFAQRRPLGAADAGANEPGRKDRAAPDGALLRRLRQHRQRRVPAAGAASPRAARRRPHRLHPPAAPHGGRAQRSLRAGADDDPAAAAGAGAGAGGGRLRARRRLPRARHHQLPAQHDAWSGRRPRARLPHGPHRRQRGAPPPPPSPTPAPSGKPPPRWGNWRRPSSAAARRRERSARPSTSPGSGTHRSIRTWSWPRSPWTPPPPPPGGRPAAPGPRPRLEQVELVPFKTAIEAGVAAVMTEHIVVPALDPEPVAATFSYAITTELLRNQMGFEGLIITDDVSMNAIANHIWTGETAGRAFEAGADVILSMSRQPEVAFAALRRAVESGRVREAQLNQSVERILRAKARLRLPRQAQVDLEQVEALINNPRFQEQAQEMADRGVALLRDDAGFLPLDSTRPQRGLLLIVSADPDPFPGAELERELTPRVDSLQVVRADRLFFKPEEVPLPATSLYDWSLVAVFLRVADRKGNVALPPNLAALVSTVVNNGKPSALLILGSPYLAERFPQAKTVLCTFSTAEITERAATRALSGQTGLSGRLPVTIPGAAERGAGLARAAVPMELAAATPDDEARLAPVFKLLDAATAQGVAPGGVLAVGLEGRLAAVHPFGRLRYSSDAPPVQPDTLYDLASLTKVIATTTAAMMLYERGALPLDARVVDYLPELQQGPDAAAKARITVRHLLTHSSGLPGYLRLFQEVNDRRQLLERLYAAPLEYAPGSQAVYSDLGMILLGEVVERSSGQPLDVFLQKNLFEPLGLRSTLFRPPDAWRDRIAPTEEDAEGRRGLIHGEVHDGNAWMKIGAAGHAGLFSTAGDLAVFCQLLLDGGVYRHRRFLQRATLELFTSRQTDITGASRALGWDTPSEPSTSGRYFSARAFGHTGFTGTSIWIDPDKQLDRK